MAELGAEANRPHAETLSAFSQTGLPKSDSAAAAGANARIMSAIHRPVVAMLPQIVQRQPMFDGFPGGYDVTARDRRRPARMVSLQPQIVGSDPVGHPHQHISARGGFRQFAAHRVDHPIGPPGAELQRIVA